VTNQYEIKHVSNDYVQIADKASAGMWYTMSLAEVRAKAQQAREWLAVLQEAERRLTDDLH